MSRLPDSYRVWCLSSNRWFSAVSDYALSSALSLHQLGMDVTFTTIQGSPTDQRQVTASLKKLPVADFGFRSWGKIAEIGKKLNPDIVIVNDGKDAAAMSLLRKTLPSVRAVFRMRGQDFNKASWLEALRWRYLSMGIDGVIAPSKLVELKLQKMGLRQPIAHIPLGRDLSMYRVNGSPHSAQGTMRPAVLLVGRLDPVKGHQRAIKMFADCLNKWPRNRLRPYLHIIGKPANLSASDIFLFAKEQGLLLDEDIFFTPEMIDNLPALMCQARLGLISSVDSEIICRVAEEFLLSGTPVMVSGVGSLNEVLFPKAGCSYLGLTDQESAQLMVDQLMTSVQESAEERAIRAGRAAELYSYEAMGHALQAFIERIAQ